MEIRLANKNNIAGIMEIERASFAHEIRESEKTFLRRIQAANGFFLVFENRGKIVGYLSAEKWATLPADETAFRLNHDIAKTHDKSGSILYVSSFALLPEARGNGNGKRAFQNALRFFLSRDKSILTFALLVNELWSNALSVYKNCGFVPAKNFPCFFTQNGKQSSAIFMLKKLR